ncbi:MAG: DUF1127 domain-containing protein [Paracoccaceae bacterium]
MAVSHTYSSTTAGYSNRLSAASHALFGAYYTWNDSRKTRKALYTLSARQLDDIGLCRADIEKIAG